MGRRPERGAGPDGLWSLEQLCAAAGVSRSAGRTAVRRGLLRPSGWRARDVPVVAAAAALPADVPAEVARRAVGEVKAALADGLLAPSSVLVVWAGGVLLADRIDRLGSAPDDAVLTVVPVGRVAAGVVTG